MMVMLNGDFLMNRTKLRRKKAFELRCFANTGEGVLE
jgi:hypothetical protein